MCVCVRSPLVSPAPTIAHKDPYRAQTLSLSRAIAINIAFLCKIKMFYFYKREKKKEMYISSRILIFGPLEKKKKVKIYTHERECGACGSCGLYLRHSETLSRPTRCAREALKMHATPPPQPAIRLSKYRNLKPTQTQVIYVSMCLCVCVCS